MQGARNDNAEALEDGHLKGLYVPIRSHEDIERHTYRL